MLNLTNMKLNYFSANPIAKIISKNGMILENEKVEAMLKNAVELMADSMHKVIFDYAPTRDRVPDVLRKKLQEIKNSKDVNNALALIVDYSDDNDLKNPKLSEAKSLLLKTIEKLNDTLKRSIEIDGNNAKVIKAALDNKLFKIQAAVDDIAKRAKELESMKKSKINESETINESFGYRGRIGDLRKELADLQTRAEGKEASNGYKKNWKSIFVALDQKLNTLDTTRDGSGMKDKELLKTLEKEVEKYRADFNKSELEAADKMKQGVEEDSELIDKYGDVLTTYKKAVEDYNRAQTSELAVYQEIKDDKIESEESLMGELFPIKMPDTDKSPRFRGHKLISAIQKALSDESVFKRTMDQAGGVDGKFGKYTKAVIQAIQKQTGNNNPNGEIDSALFGALLNSDWISKANKGEIMDIIEKISKDKRK